MIGTQIIGAERVQARIESASDRLRASVHNAVMRSSTELQAVVKEQYLSGPRPQHLGRKTGNLSRSVNIRYQDTGDTFAGRVGTNVGYGAAWELGFTVPAQTITAKKAGALFWPGARHPVKSVNQPARTQAARPFLRPALAQVSGSFHERMRRAVLEV